MEYEAIHWKFLQFRHPFSCFVRGCHKEAAHVTRFHHGEVVIQVCLCDECAAKSEDVILRGLRAGLDDEIEHVASN